MKQKKGKRKGSLLRQFPKAVIGSIVVTYFLLRVFPVMGSTNEKTTVVPYGKMENVISVTGLVAREETVLAYIGEGESTLLMQEGEKVAKNQKLAELYAGETDKETMEALRIVNQRIEEIQRKSGAVAFIQSDVEKIDQEVAALSKKIQQAVDAGQYDKVEAYKKELEELAEKKNLMVGDDSFAGKNLAQLTEEKQLLEDKLGATYREIYAEEPGYVSYVSDGYETLLSLEKIEQFTDEDLANIMAACEAEGTALEKPSVKLVKSHEWSLLLQLSPQEAEGLQTGRWVRLRARGEEREYRARVRSITEGQTGMLVILDLNQAMEGLLQLRTLQVDIARTTWEGAQVRNESLAEKDEELGVYRVNINGLVRWIPVQVLGGDETHSILSYGTFQRKDPETEETKSVETINLYDEIVIDGDSVIDGQKIR